MKCAPFLRLALIVPVLGIAVGCAETPLEFPPPSDATRSQFGTVGVLPVRLKSGREELQELGADIARGGGQGAIEGFKWAFEPMYAVCISTPFVSSGAAVICTGTLVYGIVAAPIAAAVGAIRSRPASEVEAAERSLLAGFNRMNPREALRDQIVLAGKSETGFAIRAVNEEPQDAAQSGLTEFDSIMTLLFDPLLLFDDDNMSPTVTLEMQVTASVARAKDATPLHAQTWRYWSEGENFFDLADDGARRLEVVTAKGYERLARKIVHDLFVTSSPETQNSEQPGTVWAVDTSTFYDAATPAPPDAQGAQ